MLYARCAYCGYIVPLSCSGTFMPHMTVAVEITGNGATCPMCGPLPLIFTCPFMHTQYLYLPGVSAMPQQGYTYAAVVQAQPGASKETLDSGFGQVLEKVGAGIGKGAVEAFFGQH
jgi:hypothetical protein